MIRRDQPHPFGSGLMFDGGAAHLQRRRGRSLANTVVWQRYVSIIQSGLEKKCKFQFMQR